MPAPLQEPATIYEIARPLRPFHMSRIIGSVMLASRDPTDLLAKTRPHWEVEYHYSSLSGGVPTRGSLQYVEIHPGECRFPPATQYSNDKENVYIRVYEDGRVAAGWYNEMPEFVDLLLSCD
ncbi:hypothetical protein BDZ85DRAFT_246805 [Elsinoe ampelina]|uniref:Uncharacterized protein n=1 Tax=Elsinoe ampelina TaxID=302913 RepID=A0A6A6GKY7_9PEZI|nr:hypothetical protein BDZ85DRAFT_246805 [Elsinoe ampelina]